MVCCFLDPRPEFSREYCQFEQDAALFFSGYLKRDANKSHHYVFPSVLTLKIVMALSFSVFLTTCLYHVEMVGFDHFQ